MRWSRRHIPAGIGILGWAKEIVAAYDVFFISINDESTRAGRLSVNAQLVPKVEY